MPAGRKAAVALVTMTLVALSVWFANAVSGLTTLTTGRRSRIPAPLRLRGASR
jgi:hypothetical protein